jgi:hypothetical protein
MAKQHRTPPRELNGQPGAAGPKDERPRAAARRKAGGVGRPGRPGTRGAHDVKAAGGPPAAPDHTLSSTHVQLLEVVEKQIEDIYKVLDVQVRHFGEIQQQLDELRGKVRQLMDKARISS